MLIIRYMLEGEGEALPSSCILGYIKTYILLLVGNMHCADNSTVVRHSLHTPSRTCLFLSDNYTERDRISMNLITEQQASAHKKKVVKTATLYMVHTYTYAHTYT